VRMSPLERTAMFSVQDAVNWAMMRGVESWRGMMVEKTRAGA